VEQKKVITTTTTTTTKKVRVWDTNVAAILLFWYTNMAAVTSREIVLQLGMVGRGA